MPLPCPATLSSAKPDAHTARVHTKTVRLTEIPQRSRVDAGATDIWPSQTVHWMTAAARHLCETDAVRTFPIDRIDGVDGADSAHRAVPMALYLPPGRRALRLTLPGAHATGEPCDLPNAQAGALLRRLAAQPLALELPRLPADSPTPGALRQAYCGRARVQVFPAPGAPYVDLDASWLDPMQRFNAGRRSDIRRAEQHARQMGGAQAEFHDDVGAQALEPLLDEAFEVEARSWKGQAGSALARDLPMGRFFREVARAAAASGTLRLAFLRVGGRTAAMQIAVASAQRLWLLKIGYDPAFARCRPGHLLLLQTLARAARQGLHACEFMGHAAPWTAQWTATLRACVGVRVYPLSRPGMHAWAEDGAAALGRRVHALWRRAR